MMILVSSLCQHARLDFYNTSSIKQQSAVDMFLHSGKLLWLPTNQSLFLHFKTRSMAMSYTFCLGEIQYTPSTKRFLYCLMSFRSVFFHSTTIMLVLKDFWPITVRRVWRYQRDNQNPYIEEDQTTQWPKEKVQKDKQRSTKPRHSFFDLHEMLLRIDINCFVSGMW
jgi:hypothetical protein